MTCGEMIKFNRSKTKFQVINAHFWYLYNLIICKTSTSYLKNHIRSYQYNILHAILCRKITKFNSWYVIHISSKIKSQEICHLWYTWINKLTLYPRTDNAKTYVNFITNKVDSQCVKNCDTLYETELKRHYMANL